MGLYFMVVLCTCRGQGFFYDFSLEGRGGGGGSSKVNLSLVPLLTQGGELLPAIKEGLGTRLLRSLVGF